MIVEFSIKNFRSIKELQTISFAATGLKSPTESNTDANNIVHEGCISLLKTVGIYGPNASGKSNLLYALDLFLRAVCIPSTDQNVLALLYDPFMYEDSEEGCFFQIVLIIGGKKFRYGFVVNKKRQMEDEDKHSIIFIESEWLYSNVDKNMKRLVLRQEMTVSENGLPTQKGVTIPSNIPYPHTLFLLHAAAFDPEGLPALIVNYMKGHVFNNLSRKKILRGLSVYDAKYDKKTLLSFLARFNMQYDDIILVEDGIDVDNHYMDFPLEKIVMVKNSKINSSKPHLMNLRYRESSGNQKLFDLAGLLYIAFFVPGQQSTIILDEIDGNFHPSLLIKLIGMFNNPEINKNKSQLLFTSHDTNLMSPSIMRRDQFYFTEKQNDESTKLYSLADLRGIRNDADFAKQYLAGFYGALPVLNDYVEPMEG